MLGTLAALGMALVNTPAHATEITPAALSLQLYSGLTITGAVGTVYSVEYVTEVSQSTSGNEAWRALDFIKLPTNPYLWMDHSAPATERR